jgi:hypothetical protein
MAAYDNGNRLALPESLAGKHFFYKTRGIPATHEDLALVANAVKETFETDGRGLNPAQIEIMLRKDFKDDTRGVIAALDRLLGLMGATEPEATRASILYCEWAAPHVDDSYVESAFVSLVLHTGPEPYIMQTLHTHLSHGTQQIETDTRLLNVGDVFVFDPTTAHFTAPKYPHQDELLILLQMSVTDRTDEDRKDLLHRFPTLFGDTDAYLAFEHH